MKELTEEKTRKMKGLSKAIYIIAKIVRVFLWIGFVGVAIVAVVIPMLFKHVDVAKDKVTFTMAGHTAKVVANDDRTSYVITEDDNEIYTINDEDEVKALNLLLDNIDANKVCAYLEVALVGAMAVMVLATLIMKYLIKLFKEIHDDEAIFKEEYPTYVRKMAYFSIAIIVVNFVVGFVCELLITSDITFNVDFANLFEVLILFAAAYVFEAGYKLSSKKSK